MGQANPVVAMAMAQRLAVLDLADARATCDKDAWRDSVHAACEEASYFLDTLRYHILFSGKVDIEYAKKRSGCLLNMCCPICGGDLPNLWTMVHVLLDLARNI